MKTFFSLGILISLLAVGWYYVPPPTKDKVVAFIGGALERSTQEIPVSFRDQILPKSPEKKREVLLGELKQKLEEVKDLVSEESQTPGATPAITSAADLILQGEEIIKALEEANEEKPGIADKILNKIFSSPEKQACGEP